MATKTPANTSDSGFSEDELAAMKQRAAELRAEKKGGAKKADEAEACLEAITALPQPDLAPWTTPPRWWVSNLLHPSGGDIRLLAHRRPTSVMSKSGMLVLR